MNYCLGLCIIHVRIVFVLQCMKGALVAFSCFGQPFEILNGLVIVASVFMATWDSERLIKYNK